MVGSQKYLSFGIGFILSLLASVSQAKENGFCLPTDEDLGRAIRSGASRQGATSAEWPICGVYMHGIFGSKKIPESKWELPFRKRLNEIAMAQRCRIAVPIGNKGNTWNWVGLSLREAKKRALRVCGAESQFAQKVNLIGFSGGANLIRKEGASSCSTLSGFDRVLLVGPTGTKGNSRVRACGRVTVIQDHSVPSREVLNNFFASGGRSKKTAISDWDSEEGLP